MCPLAHLPPSSLLKLTVIHAYATCQRQPDCGFECSTVAHNEITPTCALVLFLASAIDSADFGAESAQVTLVRVSGHSGAVQSHSGQGSALNIALSG